MSAAWTTDEVLREIGGRLRRFRLQQNRTMADVARDAGIGMGALERAETGKGTTLETLVRILRAHGRLEAIDAFLPEPLVSPLQLAKSGGRERQRAGTTKRRA